MVPLHGLQVGLTWTCLLWTPTWLHLELLTLILTGPHPDLVTLFLNCASPGPSEYAPSGPHLDLVTLVPPWASSGHGSTAWPASWPHLDLVSVVATWASSGCHQDQVNLVPL